MSALFIKLLNMSIAAGWLILAVIVLRFAFRKAPGWVRCTMWAFVALRLVIPFSLQSSFSVIPSVNTVSVVTVDTVQEEDPGQAVSQSEPVSASEPVSRPEYVSRPSTDPASSAGSVSSPAESGSPHIDRTGTGNALAQKSGETKRIVINTGITAVDGTINRTEPDTASRTEESADIVGTASVIWAIGAALMLAYAAFSYLALWYRVRESIKENGVYICDNIGSPFVFGIIRPRIYIPSGMDEKNLAYVLAHEKAHIKRLDPVWRLLGFILLSVYWFAPLAWIAYVLFCRDIELACDERVIRTLDPVQRAGYSEALLELTQPHRTISACPVAFGETGVKARIKKVFGYKKPTVFIIAAALILCTVLGACLMTDPMDKDKTEYPEEIQMILGGNYYMEFYTWDDWEVTYAVAAVAGLSRSCYFSTLQYRDGAYKPYDLVTIGGNGAFQLLDTGNKVTFRPRQIKDAKLHFIEQAAFKSVGSELTDGGQRYTFSKHCYYAGDYTVTFICENGRLKTIKMDPQTESGEKLEMHVKRVTYDIPDYVIFNAPGDYEYVAADTPEDAHGKTVKYCNHYGQYDIESFDLGDYFEKLEKDERFELIEFRQSSGADYAYVKYRPIGSADVYLMTKVGWYPDSETAKLIYNAYLYGDVTETEKTIKDYTDGMLDPLYCEIPMISVIRVNEYLFYTFAGSIGNDGTDKLPDVDLTCAAGLMAPLGIEIPVYTASPGLVVKHMDSFLASDFEQRLAAAGYMVTKAKPGTFLSGFGDAWLAVAPDGSAAVITRAAPDEIPCGADWFVYMYKYSYENMAGIPNEIAIFDPEYAVFVSPAKAEGFLRLISDDYPEEARAIVGGEFYMEYIVPGEADTVVMLACKDGVTCLGKRAADETANDIESFVVIGKDGSAAVTDTKNKTYYLTYDIRVDGAVLARNDGYEYTGHTVFGSGIQYDTYMFIKGNDGISIEYANGSLFGVFINSLYVYVKKFTFDIPGYMPLSVPESYEQTSAPQQVPYEESSQQPLEEYPELTMDDISVTGSLTFVSDKYPGKTLVYAGGSDISAAQTPYPFFIQGEVLYVMHWKGEDVPVCDGTLVYRFSDINTKKLSVFACVIGGWLNYDEYNGCRLMRFGELLIKYGQTDADGSPVYGTVYGFAPSVEISDSWILGAMYDKSALREGSRFFAFRSDGELYESPEWWYLVDTEGNLYTLPVPYEKRKSIERIMFDTSSDAVDDVLVYVYETYPDMAEPIPVPYSANLNDCRRFEDVEDYVAYYTLSDAERRSYAVPSELSDFAPKTLTVYRSVSPAGEGDAEKALTSFIRSFDPAFESAAFETTGTGAVTVSYGNKATLGFRDGSLWVNMAYGSLAPSSVWLTTGNLLDQDIPYLDEMIEYYGFDRSKLQVTVGDRGFYIAEYSGGMESAVEAIGAKCLHVSVSNNTVYAISACDRSAYDAEKRKGIPFSAAYEEFLKGNFIAPGLESEEFGEEEMYLLKADIIYASGIELKDDNEYVYPYYRFYISTPYDPAPLYAYIRAVED